MSSTIQKSQPSGKVPRLVIHGGRIVCPASGIDAAGTLDIIDGRVASLTPAPDHNAAATLSSETQVLNCPRSIVLPGLIDLHAHPAVAGSVFGVDPDPCLLHRGVTTVQSQGDAGADGIDDYILHTIRASATRVLLAINLSRIGESTQAGCFEDLADADVDQCARAIARHRDVVRAVSVNVSHHACGRSDPREILRRGIQVAESSELPILFGMRRPEDWAIDEQLRQLRPGDVVTYCFRRAPHCIVEQRRVLPCVRAAQDRGVLFDVGHGMASFSFEVARSAIADGFTPDTISTDLQNRHIGAVPQHDLPLVMSKLRAAGMQESAVFAAATCRPAAVLKSESLRGTLEPGACADVTVLDVTSERAMIDVDGVEVSGPVWTVRHTIRAGRLIGPQDGVSSGL